MIQEMIDAIKELIEWAFLSVLEWFFGGLASLISAIPVPSFLDDAGGMFSGIGSSAAFFISVAQIPFGLACIGSALTVRFLIRRLPFIG